MKWREKRMSYYPKWIVLNNTGNQCSVPIKVQLIGQNYYEKRWKSGTSGKISPDPERRNEIGVVLMKAQHFVSHRLWKVSKFLKDSFSSNILPFLVFALLYHLP